MSEDFVRVISVLCVKQVIGDSDGSIGALLITIVDRKRWARVANANTRVSAIAANIGPIAELRRSNLLAINHSKCRNAWRVVQGLAEEEHWLSLHRKTDSSFV